MLSVDYLNRQNYVVLSTVVAPDFIDVGGVTYMVTSTTGTDSSGNPIINVVNMNSGAITTMLSTSTVMLLTTKLTIGQKYNS